MIFEKTFYREPNLLLNGKSHTIEKVRAISLRDDLLLTIYSKKFDEYALPGGEVKLGETLEDAVRREVLEETGMSVVAIQGLVGRTTEYDTPVLDGFDVCKRINSYYLVDVSLDMADQNLEADELVYDYEPRFVQYKEVCRIYDERIKSGKAVRAWMIRESYVLGIMEKIIHAHKI